MADNYLEKRYDEVFGGRSSAKKGHARPSLDTLLAKAGGAVEFDPSYKVHELQMKAIAGAFAKVSSGLGADLGIDVHADDATVSLHFSDAIDAGIALQSMNLKAAEMGLGCHITKLDGEVLLKVGKPLAR